MRYLFLAIVAILPLGAMSQSAPEDMEARCQAEGGCQLITRAMALRIGRVLQSQQDRIDELEAVARKCQTF